MKKFFLLFLFAVAMTTTAFSERTRLHMETHKGGADTDLTKKDRNPIQLPIAVFFDSDTNILEVYCDDDNIQAEVYIYDEYGNTEAYSPYMNVALQLSSSSTHSIRLIGDGWEGESNI